MGILSILVNYGMMILCYVTGLKVYFRIHPQRGWPCLAAIPLVCLLCVWNFEAFVLYNVLFSISSLSVFLSCYKRKSKDMLAVLMLSVSLYCVGEIVELFLLYLEAYHNFRRNGFLLEGLADAAIFLLFTGSYVLFKRTVNTSIHKWKFNLNRSSYYFIVFLGLGMIFPVAIMRYTAGKINNARFFGFAIAVSFISYIGILVLEAFTVYVKFTNEQIQAAAEMEHQIRLKTEEYYNSLLKNESDTRKYRHDLLNHLICLRELISTGSGDQAIAYIDEMTDHHLKVDRKLVHTNCRVLDIFINHYFSLLEDQVCCTVSGCCNNAIDAGDVDLCTIFSNLLQNAAEALLAYTDHGRFLSIKVEQGKSFVKIEITNSFSEENRKVNRVREKHCGFGLENVKRAVEKNRGSFQVQERRNIYLATVILSNSV